MLPSLFPPKNTFVHIKLLEFFSLARSVAVKDDITPDICLLLEGDFLNFPLFPFFRLSSSIAQNKNPETPEIFKPLKTLNSLCQALRDSTSICQNNDFSSPISNKNLRTK